MKKYTANHYFTSHQGLNIADESGETVINIKAASGNEVRAIADKILSELNRDFHTKTALLADNQANWEMGLITPDERTDRITEIMASNF